MTSRHRTSSNTRYIRQSLFYCGDRFGSSVNMKAAAARFAKSEQYDPNVRLYKGCKVGGRWVFTPTAWRKRSLAVLVLEHFDRLGGVLE